MKKNKIILNKVNESNIEVHVKENKKSKKQLQRTKKWREERRGNWTGSQLKNIMTCSPGKGQLKWDNIDKLFAFGLTALKYIYENAKERQTGRYIDSGDGTWEMQYGTKVEPLIKKLTKEKLKELGVKGKLKSVGYKSFSMMPNAGVSSDSILVDKKGKTIATVEMKACTSWGTHYERVFSLTDEKSKDFWQIQGQIIAHEVDICYYVVAEPPENIKDYLFYDGDIKDLYDQFKKECNISIETVKGDKMHQQALFKRIIIAEETLNDWLATNGVENLESLLNENIKMFENDPKKFDNYIAPMPFQKELKDAKKQKNKKNKSKLSALVGSRKILVSSNKTKQK